MKVNIHLAEVKAVEELDDIAYAFQVKYLHGKTDNYVS